MLFFGVDFECNGCGGGAVGSAIFVEELVMILFTEVLEVLWCFRVGSEDGQGCVRRHGASDTVSFEHGQGACESACIQNKERRISHCSKKPGSTNFRACGCWYWELYRGVVNAEA